MIYAVTAIVSRLRRSRLHFGRFSKTTLPVNIRRIKRNNFYLRKKPSARAWPTYDPQDPVRLGLLTFQRTHPA